MSKEWKWPITMTAPNGNSITRVAISEDGPEYPDVSSLADTLQKVLLSMTHAHDPLRIAAYLASDIGEGGWDECPGKSGIAKAEIAFLESAEKLWLEWIYYESPSERNAK